MDRYDAWKRQRELLRQIQHAAGLDPDGPPRPMSQPWPFSQRREDTRRELRRASEAAYRDAMLRRAIGLLR